MIVDVEIKHQTITMSSWFFEFKDLPCPAETSRISRSLTYAGNEIRLYDFQGTFVLSSFVLLQTRSKLSSFVICIICGGNWWNISLEHDRLAFLGFWNYRTWIGEG